MIIASRLYWWEKHKIGDVVFDPDNIREPDSGSFYAALFHDINIVLLVVGTLVEGFRMI